LAAAVLGSTPPLVIACGALAILAGSSAAQSTPQRIGDTPLKKDATLTCPSGAIAQGMECEGPFCDKKALICVSYVDGIDPSARHAWSSWVFAGDNPIQEFGNRFVSALQDKENRLRVRFIESELFSKEQGCEWKTPSEDGDALLMCAQSQYVSGIGCDGDFCESPSILCCPGTISEPAAEESTDGPVQEETSESSEGETSPEEVDPEGVENGQ
jgi:hypothetical protein